MFISALFIYGLTKQSNSFLGTGTDTMVSRLAQTTIDLQKGKDRIPLHITMEYLTIWGNSFNDRNHINRIKSGAGNRIC